MFIRRRKSHLTVKKVRMLSKVTRDQEMKLASVSLCPSGICTEDGRQFFFAHVNGIYPCLQVPEDHPANPVLISVEDNITIYSFPYSQSQATLSPSQMSNACTLISLLVCCAFQFSA